MVPFELQNIPPDYREYYKVKRNNFFSSIQRFPLLWGYYVRLDAIWLRAFSDLKPPGTPHRIFPLILFFNAHAKMRVSIELAFTGCLSEARSILRDAVEFVAHAHTMIHDPQLQAVWLGKNEEAKAFQDAFERNKKRGVFKGLDELHKAWADLSELGVHANLNALVERFTMTGDHAGNQNWALNYCGVEDRVWEVGTFSLLLTCFTMEQTFYHDYAERLHLDHVLIEMRTDFERHKEMARGHLIKKHKLPPPAERSRLVVL